MKALALALLLALPLLAACASYASPRPPGLDDNRLPGGGRPEQLNSTTPRMTTEEQR